jgi:uncharacterized membrane protein YbhN (UPF0104 family)
MPTSWARWVLAAASVALAATLVVLVLPRVTGTSWVGTGETVEQVSALRLAELVLVWTLGVWLHTLVLRASLPGLRTHRALALNLGGSSISNVLPMGGAAGIGLNYAMLRSWGYSQVQISAFAAVSNLVVALIKVLIALAALTLLLFSPVTGVAAWWPHVGAGGATAAAAGVVGLAALARAGWRTQRAGAARAALRLAASEAASAVRSGWRALAVGAVGQPAAQALLLWLCLSVVDARVGAVALLVTYGVERLLTLVPFTPGGVGVVETGASAVLVGFGVDPAAAVAGFLLFRVFSYLIEIPVGGVIAAAWLLRPRARLATRSG